MSVSQASNPDWRQAAGLSLCVCGHHRGEHLTVEVPKGCHATLYLEHPRLVERGCRAAGCECKQWRAIAGKRVIILYNLAST